MQAGLLRGDHPESPGAGRVLAHPAPDPVGIQAPEMEPMLAANVLERNRPEVLGVGPRRRLERDRGRQTIGDLDVEMPGSEPNDLLAKVGPVHRRATLAARKIP